MPTLLARLATGVGAVALATVPLACRNDGAGSSATLEASVASAGADAVSPSAAPSPAAGFPVPKASVDLVLNPGGGPAYAGPTGSIEGIVTVEGPPAPSVAVNAAGCPAAVDTYGKLFREGRASAPGGPRPLADAVVVVTGYTGFYVPEKSEAVKVTITPACAYPARTIALTYGQRLDVANQTALLFAPTIDDSSNAARRVAPPKENGEPVKLYPVKAGHFHLTDGMEPFVKEDLYVFRHPLHAVTDLAGRYRIEGVPVGKLKVGVHHPTVDADAESELNVVAGAVERVDLTLTFDPKLAADAGAPRSAERLK